MTAERMEETGMKEKNFFGGEGMNFLKLTQAVPEKIQEVTGLPKEEAQKLHNIIFNISVLTEAKSSVKFNLKEKMIIVYTDHPDVFPKFFNLSARQNIPISSHQNREKNEGKKVVLVPQEYHLYIQPNKHNVVRLYDKGNFYIAEPLVKDQNFGVYLVKRKVKRNKGTVSFYM